MLKTTGIRALLILLLGGFALTTGCADDTEENPNGEDNTHDGDGNDGDNENNNHDTEECDTETVQLEWTDEAPGYDSFDAFVEAVAGTYNKAVVAEGSGIITLAKGDGNPTTVTSEKCPDAVGSISVPLAITVLQDDAGEANLIEGSIKGFLNEEGYTGSVAVADQQNRLENIAELPEHAQEDNTKIIGIFLSLDITKDLNGSGDVQIQVETTNGEGDDATVANSTVDWFGFDLGEKVTD